MYHKMADWVRALVVCLLFCGVLLSATAQSNLPTGGASGQPEDGMAVTFDVIEESPIQSYVGNVLVASGLDLALDPSDLQQLEFGFIPQRGQGEEYFRLDTTSGILRTARVIDREELCPEEVDCFLDLGAAIVKPSDLFQVIRVRIRITDINDQDPSFMPPTFEVRFSESDLAGTSRTLPVAMDLDSPRYGIHSYQLVSNLEEFDLVQAENPLTGAVDLALTLKGTLDREWRDTYRVVVEARDGGTPSRVGRLVITVSVGDDNDHTPIFANSTFAATIAENHVVNVTFFTMEAQDLDSGPNGQIQYSFSPRTASLFGSLFAVSPDSGEVKLRAPLDFESRSGFHLEVVAADSGSSPRSSLATLIVRVVDVNDNAPRITVSTLSQRPEAEVEENSPRGRFVAHVSAFDADTGADGEVTCSLSHWAFGLEPMRSRGQYKVLTSATLDRESFSRFSLTVVCRDMGFPSLTSSAGLVVSVLDQNDHPPVFLQTSYVASVPENNARDTYILQVNATDPDSGDNALLSYTVAEGFESILDYIRLDPTSGVIQAARRMDHERTQKLNFLVTARDNGSPARNSSTSVTINILDLNDEKPVFSNSHYLFSVPENRIPGTPVGQLRAHDPDSPNFAIHQFSIMPKNIQEDGFFTVDADSGHLVSLRSLDREVQSTFEMIAYVTDIDNPSLVSSAAVTIAVEDENDNTPQITYPVHPNATFRISNSAPRGYNITRITADDSDVGNNGNVTFMIFAPEGGSHLFQIDPSSGVVSTIASLSRIPYGEYKIRIVVSDRGTPVRTSASDIRVVVDQDLPLITGDGLNRDGQLLQTNNLTIIIAVAGASGFIIVVLSVAILVLKTMDRLTCCHGMKGFPPLDERDPSGSRHLDQAGAGRDYNIKAVEANGYFIQQSRDPLGVSVDSISIQNERRCTTQTGGATTVQSDQPPGVRACPAHLNPDRHLEAHLLALLKSDAVTSPEEDSTSSADVSNADSGRGLSEEGVSAEGIPYRENHRKSRPSGPSHPDPMLPPRGLPPAYGSPLQNGSRSGDTVSEGRPPYVPTHRSILYRDNPDTTTEDPGNTRKQKTPDLIQTSVRTGTGCPVHHSNKGHSNGHSNRVSFKQNAKNTCDHHDQRSAHHHGNNTLPRQPPGTGHSNNCHHHNINNNRSHDNGTHSNRRPANAPPVVPVRTRPGPQTGRLGPKSVDTCDVHGVVV